MKKLISILIIVTCAFAAIAQDKVVDIPVKTGFTWGTYVEYAGTAADTITSNQDSIDYVFEVKTPNYIKKVALFAQLDTIAGDDTITVQLLGSDFEDATIAEVIAAATVNLDGATTKLIFDDYSAGADELSFRYYTYRVLRTGTGDGVELNNLEFKIYTD